MLTVFGGTSVAALSFWGVQHFVVCTVRYHTEHGVTRRSPVIVTFTFLEHKHSPRGQYAFKETPTDTIFNADRPECYDYLRHICCQITAFYSGDHAVLLPCSFCQWAIIQPLHNRTYIWGRCHCFLNYLFKENATAWLNFRFKEIQEYVGEDGRVH